MPPVDLGGLNPSSTRHVLGAPSLLVTMRALIVLPWLVYLLAGCTTSEGRIVFGVTSEFRAGIDLDALDVVVDAGDDHRTDRHTLGTDQGEVSFPHDFPVGPAADGTSVAVLLKGYLNGFLMVERKGASTVKGGADLLYPMTLESRCRYSIPGAEGMTPCDSGTCVAGQCVDPYLPPEDLDPYDPNWANVVGDVCKPAGAGAPAVFVGLGQSDYKPAENDDIAQVEAGPQGGYHIWVSLRTKNLRRSGSQTELGGEIPELGITLDPLKVIFTLAPDEGGYCKLHGLRFQLALGPLSAVEPMLGRKVDLHAKVTDKDGASATGNLRVTLSSDVK